VSILRNFDSRFNENGETEKIKLIAQATKQVISSLNEKNGAQKYEFLDTIGDQPDFDYSQDYRNYLKKNLIEIQYENLLGKKSNFFALGIYSRSIWNFKVSVYDSDGLKTEIKELNLEPISQLVGIFLFPILFYQSNEDRDRLAEKRLNIIIRQTIEMAFSRGIKFENFDSSYKISKLPFRMKINRGICDSIIPTGLNAPGIRTTWTPNNLHRGCDFVINFSNKTDKIINIDTQQFTLVTDKNIHSPKKEINIFQRNISGNASSTNTSVQHLLQSVNLQPNTTGNENIELFFEYPFNEKPLFVRWQDSNQSTSVVEVTVPR